MTTLRQLRGRQHWTLQEAHAQTGIPYAHLSRIETGHVTPTLRTVERLAAAYGVPQATVWRAVHATRGVQDAMRPAFLGARPQRTGVSLPRAAERRGNET